MTLNLEVMSAKGHLRAVASGSYAAAHFNTTQLLRMNFANVSLYGYLHAYKRSAATNSTRVRAF